MTPHEASVLRESDARETAILADAGESDIQNVDNAEWMLAGGWFGTHRPAYAILEVWQERGEIRVALVLRAPVISDEAVTEIWRKNETVSEISYTHIATER